MVERSAGIEERAIASRQNEAHMKLPNDQHERGPRGAQRNLISPVDEAGVFWRMRRQMAVAMVWQALSHAALRFSLVILLSGVLWFILFALFTEGFAFFASAIRTSELLDAVTHAVFTHFFFALMIMLVFSSSVILYGSLYRGPDIAFLFSLPVRAERVFLHKFQEAVFLSSWAFLLLASPMLLAYANVGDVPWYFYLEMVPALIAFTYLPAAIGAILCLCVVRWIPSRRMALLAAIGVATFLALLAYGAFLTTNTHADFFTPGWMQEMLGRMQATESRWLPSWWLSTGLLSAAKGEAAESVMFLVLLVSNALFVRQLGIGCAAKIYRSSYSRLYTQHSVKRYVRLAWIDWLASTLTAFLPAQMRQLILKDFRVFRRDPLQWTQFLIFFGLLVLYFIGVRRFSYDSYHVVWVHLISFLNVYVVGLLLATFTTRFIFPMVSLEARRFWILGLLPVRRETILWSKFAFALVGSLVPCSGLVLLSDSMLRVDWLIAVSHQVTCLVLCVGLSGIAVGLGAGMPSPREQSPSRIAAGFGGTLNLVASTLYIILVVLLTAVPAHFYFASIHSGAADMMVERFALSPWLVWWLLWGTIGSVVLGAAATFLPLWLGFRALRRFEF
jgi:ABC-2 type transport system permease protein